jgi:NADPH-dependent curcumin reductase CurA
LACPRDGLKTDAGVAALSPGVKSAISCAPGAANALVCAANRSAVMSASRQIHLLRRPRGVPVPEDFAVVEVTTPDASEGQVQVQNLLMSVDPYMRPRLTADQPLNALMIGGGIGRVLQSRNPRFKEGDVVRHGAGMQERFVSDGQGMQVLKPDPALSLSVYMHALGGTGITAYGGLLETGALKDGEQVFVSTAGGAVGSVVAQIAKIKGCYVVGTTGADDKAAWLRDEAGLDAVINYKTQPLAEALTEATPRGIDVYFENVGGAVWQAVLPLLNGFARVPVCGLIAQYSASGPPAAPNLLPATMRAILTKSLTLRGFINYEFAPDHYAEFLKTVAAGIADGRIRYREDITEGLENAPEAFMGMLQGKNFGKVLVHVGR